MDSDSPHPDHLRFDDRVLAETVAAWEQIDARAIDDREANDIARQLDGEFESRLVHRARALREAAALRDALRHARGTIGVATLAGLMLALLAGVATARAALGVPRDEPVNIFHVLAALLGPQTILLALWLIIMLAPRKAGPLLSIASLGGLIVRIGQWLAQRIHPGRAYVAAVAGISRAFVRGGLGRWTFSALSHALWLSFSAGALAMVVFLLSTRQYAFAWETTILSESAYEPLTRAVAALPTAVGFLTPSDAQIAASRWRGVAGEVRDESANQAWSGLIVGSLVVYAIGPRLMLLGLCLGRRRAAKKQYRLDIERPEFARLREALQPDVAAIGIVDSSPDALAFARNKPSEAVGHPASSLRTKGLPAIVGLELPPNAHGSAWPPAIHGVRWHDLGVIDSRADRQRVRSELSSSVEQPAALVIVCSLTTTPDRGLGSTLTELAGCVADSPILILTGGQRMRERAASALETRLNDWRQAAIAAGLHADRVVEIDLDHLTDATQSKLASLVKPDTSVAQTRRLEQAFEVIAKAVRPPKAIDSSAQIALHADIARVYGDAPPRWRTMLRTPADIGSISPANLARTLTDGAQRFTQLLPDRLKRSPKWLAAGATAGALGCVAAAALISPVAIGALPLWSGIGAAIAAAGQLSAKDRSLDAEPAAPTDVAAIVRSAALFAMLLELQGFDERIITRVLDEVVQNDDDDAMTDPTRVDRWLAETRHRFDLAVAKEARS